MDLITYAVERILNVVPREILRLAYIGKQDYRGAPKNLSTEIRRKTVEGRVIIDTNIVGGETIHVDLSGLKPVFHDQYHYVFEIPPERVNHRKIMTALSVNYMSYNKALSKYLPGVPAGTGGNVSDVMSAAHRAFDSRSNIPVVSNSDVDMVSDYTVRIRNHLHTASVVQLRCIVENEERLANISMRNAPAFATLCLHAAKAYIYKELLLTLERGYLEHGQELGAVKNYVDGLSDAEENYQTYLEENWAAISVMNDRPLYDDLLKMQLDPGI